MSAQKMGFWAVLSFVISAQVGSGVFVLPSKIAPCGTLGLFSWFIVGAGALLLALVFAGLCHRYPFTGGAYVYVTKGFGRRTGFYVAWTYWVVAWFSSAPILAVAADSLCTLFGLRPSPHLVLFFEIFILAALTALNCRGVEASGRSELILSVIKFFPLVVFPFLLLFFITPGNFLPLNPTPIPWHAVLNQAGFAMVWGFLGVEAITAPAGSIKNAAKTLPRALVLGEIIVLSVYVLNSVSVMGILPSDVLATTASPYSLAFEKIFGLAGERLMAFFIAVVCTAAMNAWVLTMGQVAKGAAEDGFFPRYFAKTNSCGAPVVGILVSTLLLLITLVTLSSHALVEQVGFVIDVAVACSVVIYSLCSWVYIRKIEQKRWQHYAIGWGALVFCAWLLWGAGSSTLLYALVFPALGIPFEYFWTKNRCALLS